MNTPPGFPDPAAPQPPTGGQPVPPQGPPPPGQYGPPPGSGQAPVYGAPGTMPPAGTPPTYGTPSYSTPNYGMPGSGMPGSGMPGQPGGTPQPPVPQNSSKTAYILLGSAVVIALGLVAFLVTRADDSTAHPAVPTVPSFTIPDFTIPEITIPQITIPEITIPEITVPNIPTVPSIVVTPTLPATPTTVAGTNLLTGPQLADVIGQIATARGANPLRILSANLYGEYVILQVQDPTKPANVDQYMWRNGSVGAPEPVTLTGDGDLESNLFSNTDVNWAAIPGLVQAALAQIPIEGANVSHINIERNLPFSADVQIRVFVDGTRGSGYLDADAQGNIITVSQS